MKTIFQFTVLSCLLIGSALCSPAQTPVPPPAPDYQPLTGADLDKLLGPIALYPDPLIAVILPAATVPTQIVLADRYLAAGGDPNQIDAQPWDASVKALARYPTVLKYLDDNLYWTTVMGQAFLYQQNDVMDSIQRLRAQAQSYGNLPSTPQQQVIYDNGIIEVVPANPEVIYIPEYNPEFVYYRPVGPPFITFGIGWIVGGWLNCDFDWLHHHLRVWEHDHPRPDGWWHERGAHHDSDMDRGTHEWHPRNHPGPGGFGFHGGDRGWNNPNTVRPGPSTPHAVPIPHDNRGNQGHPAMPGQPRPEPFTPHERVAPPHAPTPNIPHPPAFNAPQQRYIPPRQNFPAPQPRSTAPQPPVRTPHPDAFIGIQSPQDTRAFSARGAQSMQSKPTPPPAHYSAPAPAPHNSAPSGGGGAGHGGGGSSGGGGGGHHR